VVLEKVNFGCKYADIFFKLKVIVAETIEASAWGAVLIILKLLILPFYPKTKLENLLPNKDSKIYEQSFEKI
jgi:gluconokinase